METALEDLEERHCATKLEEGTMMLCPKQEASASTHISLLSVEFEIFFLVLAKRLTNYPKGRDPRIHETLGTHRSPKSDDTCG